MRKKRLENGSEIGRVLLVNHYGKYLFSHLVVAGGGKGGRKKRKG